MMKHSRDSQSSYRKYITFLFVYFIICDLFVSLICYFYMYWYRGESIWIEVSMILASTVPELIYDP